MHAPPLAIEPLSKEGADSHMRYYSVTSSSISEVGYDTRSNTLAVRFQNGSEYHYFGVPASEFHALRSAPSVGTYLNTRIKPSGYAYTKVS